MSPRSLVMPVSLIPLPALAAEVGAGGTAPELGTSAVQMVFGLLVVLALLLGTLWLIKRLGQPRGPVAGLMRIVAAVAVGARERVVILELGNSWLVLGVAPGQVTTLAEIPRQEVPALPENATAHDFPAWLQQIVARRGKP
ncbi:MAG: flagellar biosynthetic protein FliO [Rhodocyclaceae bacterium]|nr:flagellar biosynthetic protein FliO [Rhodocyclaceae bacterium]